MQYHPNLLTSDFKEYLHGLSLSAATSKFYISDIRVFTRWIYQTTGTYNITRDSFKDYESNLKERGLPTQTVNRKLSSLRLFNKYLLEKGYLQENVMKQIRNNSRTLPYATPALIQTAMLLILFGVIVILGSVILTESKRHEKDTLPGSTAGVNLPFVVQVGPTTAEAGALTAQNLNPISIEEDRNLSPNNQASGRDVIPSGFTSKRILVGNLTSTSLVFVTPTVSPENANYFVIQENGAFTLKLTKPISYDFSFNWFAIANQLPIDSIRN